MVALDVRVLQWCRVKGANRNGVALTGVWYNGGMETKDKIDLLVKRAELIYKKLFIFLAIAGGSWVYGLKDTENAILRVLILAIFFLSAVAIILNLLKFGEIQKQLKEIADD